MQDFNFFREIARVKPATFDPTTFGAINLPYHRQIRVLGYNGDVGATREDVWSVGGVYVPPSSAIQLQVVSTDANDTAAGTGARTIDLHGLDADYNEIYELITLNGTTPVLTTKTYLRVNDTHLMTIGTPYGASAGNISVQSVGGATTYARIDAGSNRQRQAIYTVPANRTLYITDIVLGVGKAAGQGAYAEFQLRTTSTHWGEYTPGVFQYKSLPVIQNNTVAIPYSIPIYIPPKTDVKIAAISENGICSAEFGGWIEGK